MASTYTRGRGRFSFGCRGRAVSEEVVLVVEVDNGVARGVGFAPCGGHFLAYSVDLYMYIYP
jgi:hypothetical protein